MTFLAMLMAFILILPLPMGNLGLMCGRPWGGMMLLGPGRIMGPRGPITLGPMMGGISGRTPRPRGPKRGGGPLGPIIGGLGRGGIILWRMGANSGGRPTIGGAIRRGIVGLPPKRGSGGRIPTGGILGPSGGPRFKGLILLLFYTRSIQQDTGREFRCFFRHVPPAHQIQSH